MQKTASGTAEVWNRRFRERGKKLKQRIRAGGKEKVSYDRTARGF